MFVVLFFFFVFFFFLYSNLDFSNFRVDVTLYDQLLSMGFPKGASAEALRQSNNDITNSLQVHAHVIKMLYLKKIS